MDSNIIIFLNSTMNEAEFFHVPGFNTITLGDHLESMKTFDEAFIWACQDALKSMKKKCDWVQTVSFNGSGEFFQTGVRIFTIDNDEIIATLNVKNGKYEAPVKDVPKMYLLSKKIRNSIQRTEELGLIQKELLDIDIIGRQIYEGMLYPAESISGNFTINYISNVGMDVTHGNGENTELIARFYNSNKKNTEKTYLNENNKPKLLNKILLNQKL